jgi:hypothetical protein
MTADETAEAFSLDLQFVKRANPIPYAQQHGSDGTEITGIGEVGVCDLPGERGVVVMPIWPPDNWVIPELDDDYRVVMTPNQARELAQVLIYVANGVDER